MKKFTLLLITIFISLQSIAQEGDPAATEVWTPEPSIVIPGSASVPPSDAIILFNGKNLDGWVTANETKSPARWIVSEGIIKVANGSGNIQTKRAFTDYQLHIEWQIPADVAGSGQHRGNSGLFLASTGSGNSGYEMQILDCYQNKTYVNGQTASVYKQFIPLVNACKKPGEWQSYDIVWTAPRFHDDGSLLSAARLTAFHNGVLVQNNVELKGETVYIGQPKYKKHGASPIKLQDHGDQSAPLGFRNIWIREL